VPNPNASQSRAFIPSKDFALSKRFYAALGWPTQDVGPGLALVSLADQQQFYLQDYYAKEFADNCMLHVTVDDAPAWHERITALLSGGEFAAAGVRPPARQPYGADVVFLHDPSGVLLHLCQWDR
jgi:predicted enzyme related to lactoylglutathione lyase